MDKPRILILNCYADNHRRAHGGPLVVPQSIAAATLAGMLDAHKVDVRIACEFRSGPFLDRDALRWAQLLILTGLNTAFDRMKQVAAYARTLNPGIAIAAGGPAVRMLPNLSRRYFDYVCGGDVEDVADVVDDVFGPGYGSAAPLPRYDLMRRPHLIGYAETSRNCNFRCSFCAMTAEDRAYRAYDLDYLERQVAALGYRQCVMFLDQNFFAGPRAYFRARLAALREMHAAGRFGGWAALVTADFFKDEENLRLARESGCIGVFSGVESFSREQISAFNKKQNLLLPQVDMISRCLEAGMVFHYGLVFDPAERRIEEFEAELDFIVANPRITLPSFLSFAIPLLGTPLFARRLREGGLLPSLRLRDMDGRSIVTHTLDPLPRAMEFALRMDTGLMAKRRILQHALGFARRYRRSLGRWGLVSGLANAGVMAFPLLGTNGRDGLRVGQAGRRSCHASTEPLGTLYQPDFPVPERYRSYFEPLHVTDAQGALHPDLHQDAASVAREALPLHLPNAAVREIVPV